MKKFSLVKTSTLALSSIMILSAVSPSLAEAATAYKVKSGKLVVAKSNKVVKGSKVYKNVLYVNGKKATGTKVYKNILYVKGKKATGTKVYKKIIYVKGKKVTGTKVYKNILYLKGKQATGNKVYKNVLYVSGKKPTGSNVVGTKLYVKGKLATGTKVFSNKLYIKGKLATGYKKNGETLFLNGVKFTGDYENRYYKAGSIHTGVAGKFRYEEGEKLTGLFGKALYVDGLLNTGYYVYGKTLYKDTKEDLSQVTYTGNQTEYNGKLFDKGALANGIVMVNGKEVEYVNGLPRKVDTTPTEPTKPSDLPNEEIINQLKTLNITVVNSSNLEEAKEWIKAYEKLTLSERQQFATNMAKLQQLIADYESSITMTVAQINDYTKFTEVTAANLAEAQRLLDAYDRLTASDKLNITYKIDELRTLVTIYQLNTAGTTVNAANVQEIQALLAKYNALSAAEREKLTVDIERLQAAFDKYVKDNNGDFTVITTLNIEDARKFVADYDQMTPEQKAAVTVNIANIRAAIAAYDFDQKPKFTSIRTSADLAEAEAIIAAYHALSGNVKSKVLYDILDLQAAVDAYKFDAKATAVDTNNVTKAQTLLDEFNALSTTVKVKVTFNFTNVNNTIEADGIVKKATALGTISTITDKTLADKVKGVILSYDQASSAVQAKAAEVNIASFKAKVAHFDFYNYYNTVSEGSLGNYTTNEAKDSGITREEVLYLARMYDAMEPKITASLADGPNLAKLNAVLATGLAVLKPNVTVVWGDGEYELTNLDNELYDDIQYNYEEEYKYTRSLNYRTTR